MKNEDGFSLVEAMVSLAVGAILIFAFYDLYTSTVRMSQNSLEQAYAYNMAIRYADGGKFAPSGGVDNVVDNALYDAPSKHQPEARGYYHTVTRSETVSGASYRIISATVDYGTRTTNRPTVTVKVFVRYDGGLYY